MKAEATLKYKKNVERYIALIRLFIILFCASSFYLFYNDIEENKGLILSFTILSISYGAYINAFLPFNNLKLRWAIGITYSVDLILILTWIFLSGGQYSPYWPLLMISIIGFARRFNPKSTLLMAGIYCLCFYLVGVYESTVPSFFVTPNFFLKIGFILISGILVSVYRFEDYSKRKGRYNQEIILLNRLQHFFKSSNNQYIILDEQYNVEYLSTVYGTQYEKEFRGKQVFDFIAKEHHPAYRNALRNAKESRKAQSLIVDSNVNLVKTPQTFEAKIEYQAVGGRPCFLVFFVPLTLNDRQDVIEVKEKTIQPDNLEIWILEDNDINIVLFERILKKLGYTNIKSFLNGKLALDELQTRSPDSFHSTLFFIDLEMPVMNGEQFILSLNHEYSEILNRSIGMTAHIREDVLQLFPGTDNIPYWLPKPFNVELVERCIKDVLNGYQPNI